MIPHETATKKEYVYRGKIINVRRDEVAFPNGKESTREIVEHRGAVAVAAVDEEGCIYPDMEIIIDKDVFLLGYH